MRRGELIFNTLLGVSILLWSFIGFYLGLKDEFSIIRLAASGLNLCVGFLFIRRNPVVIHGSFRSILVSFPSFILGGALFKMAHPLASWPYLLEIIFVIGVICAIVSFLSLGKNFAIFPDFRGISTGGPYNLIRHPCYTSELILISCCCAANCTSLSVFLLMLFVFFLRFRIEEEEQLLALDNDYVKYKQKVKWKIIPYLW